MAEEKRKPLARLKEKRPSGVAVGLLLHERFDELGDLLLLATRQFRRGLKHQLQAAFGRLLLGLGWRDTQERVHAHAEDCGHFRQHFAAWRRAAS